MYWRRFVMGVQVAIGSAAAISKVAISNGHCIKKHAVCFKDLMLKLPTYSFLFQGVTQYPTPSFEKVWSVTTRNTSVQSITDSMTSMSTYPSPKTQRSTLSTLLQKSHLWLTHSSTQPRDFKSDSKKLLFFLCCICLSRLLKHYESLWAIIYFIEMTWSLNSNMKFF